LDVLKGKREELAQVTPCVGGIKSKQGSFEPVSEVFKTVDA